MAYHANLTGHGPHTLHFHGLVPPAEVLLDGEPILSATGMFRRYEVPVTLDGEAELTIVSRPLDELPIHKFGRARWRPKLIDTPALRGVRTSLLGHMPGWCPPLRPSGPWRPVELIAETGPLRVRTADLRAGYDSSAGTLALTLAVEWDGPPSAPAFIEVAGTRTALEWRDDTTLHADLTLPGIEPWWPHTHGEPTLYPVAATVGDTRIDLGRTGFRSIAVDRGPDGAGFALTVNGVPVFCRGACWVPEASLPSSREAYAPALARMVEAGMNMVRVGGTMVYEADAFHDLCDELGILVWQDFMFANFDYPADPAFLEEARVEAAQFLDRTQASSSLAVLCGGSEMEQQAAMLGLPATSWTQPLTAGVLAEEAARWRPDVPYLTNSPTGGPLPFAANAGVTHYYGVGAYRRPLEDARLAGVRFASECLAFANLPDELPPGVPAVHHPDWKRGIPRDPGAAWDFEDVRDHYLERLYATDARRLRFEDPDRYLRLSRAVSAEVMEAVFAEWRRPGSTCRGGLVWFLRDIAPGCGWGVLDAEGVPKAAWHGLKRAFRPVQLLLTDEGVNGLAVHLLNETAHAVPARLSLTALRHGETPVVRAERAVTIPARGSLTIPATDLAGRFFDFTYAYRFGPPAHDVTVASLWPADGGEDGREPLAEAFHFPQGRALPRTDLGLSATVERDGQGWLLRLETRRFACSVHVEDAGFRAVDSWFHLPPGAERTVRLLPKGEGDLTPDGEVHAVNGMGPVRYKHSCLLPHGDDPAEATLHRHPRESGDPVRASASHMTSQPGQGSVSPQTRLFLDSRFRGNDEMDTAVGIPQSSPKGQGGTQ